MTDRTLFILLCTAAAVVIIGTLVIVGTTVGFGCPEHRTWGCGAHLSLAGERGGG